MISKKKKKKYYFSKKKKLYHKKGGSFSNSENWKCDSCEYNENKISNLICKNCGIHKGWLCPKCNFRNPIMSEICEMECGTQREFSEDSINVECFEIPPLKSVTISSDILCNIIAIRCLKQSNIWDCGFHSLKNALLTIKYIFDNEFSLTEYFESLNSQKLYDMLLENWRYVLESSINVTLGINPGEHKRILRYIQWMPIDSSNSLYKFRFQDYVPLVCSINCLGDISLLYNEWLSELEILPWQDGTSSNFKLFSLMNSFINRDIPLITFLISCNTTLLSGINHFITIVFRHVSTGIEIIILDSEPELSEDRYMDIVDSLINFYTNFDLKLLELLKYHTDNLIKIREMFKNNLIYDNSDTYISSNLEILISYIHLLLFIFSKNKKTIIDKLKIDNTLKFIKKIIEYFFTINLEILKKKRNTTTNYIKGNEIVTFINSELIAKFELLQKVMHKYRSGGKKIIKRMKKSKKIS